MPPNDKSRPGEKAAPAENLNDNANVHLANDISRAADAFVILVLTPQGKFRRRVYLSLHSAEKAFRHTVTAGKPAHLVMCHLTPVAGGGLDD